MNKQYYHINWSPQHKTGKNWKLSILVTDENNWTIIAYIDSPEWRCLKKMLRNHPAIVVDEKHPWYDFVYIIFEFINDRSEV